jgi:SH3-domain binding protein 5
MSIIEDNEESGTKYKERMSEYESESLDPRIQTELERLNKSATDINKMENELEEAKQLFINSRQRQLQRLEFLQKKFGNCIMKAKPYYEAMEKTEKLQQEAQKTVQEYQRANSLYKTAKETLSVAENNLMSGEIPDAWQEHISSTITKINTSKKNVDQAEDNHRKKTVEYQAAEEKCQSLEKDLKKHIIKSQLVFFSI